MAGRTVADQLDERGAEAPYPDPIAPEIGLTVRDDVARRSQVRET